MLWLVVVVCLFSFLGSIPFYEIHHNLFTHSAVDRYLNSFQFLAIKKKTAANILMPDSW